ncbi:MAG: DUF5652 family protein [Proteiniphilum sp.]|jgi:NADH:ubiquinone oxidoreductase subunit 3 (subunit A)|nr:DUF5652 family protein [Proteiniphilum sp.]
MPDSLANFSIWFIIVIVVFSLFDAVMKVIAMWKSARNNHLAWFICIAIFNTIGILPIVYLVLHGKKEIPEAE